MKKALGLLFSLTIVLMQACAPSKELASIQSRRLADISYRIDNQAISQLVSDSQKQSLLKIGQRYSTNKLARERERLTTLIQANGVKDFDRKSVSFLVIDTTRNNRVFSVVTIIAAR